MIMFQAMFYISIIMMALLPIMSMDYFKHTAANSMGSDASGY